MYSRCLRPVPLFPPHNLFFLSIIHSLSPFRGCPPVSLSFIVSSLCVAARRRIFVEAPLSCFDQFRLVPKEFSNPFHIYSIFFFLYQHRFYSWLEIFELSNDFPQRSSIVLTPFETIAAWTGTPEFSIFFSSLILSHPPSSRPVFSSTIRRPDFSQKSPNEQEAKLTCPSLLSFSPIASHPESFYNFSYGFFPLCGFSLTKSII